MSGPNTGALDPPPSTERRDIEGREDLRTLVDAFYRQVAVDDQLGFIFEKIAAVDWDSHLPKMVDFWEKALFQKGPYRGNPLRTHLDLSEKTGMEKARFDHWLELFRSTIDAYFVGDRAEHLKRIAADMAQVMHSRISGEAIPFSGQPPSTPDQSPQG